MFENNYDKIVSDTVTNTAPRDRSFQGLQEGQVVKRKIRRGKGANRYIALTEVSVSRNEEVTDIDNRIMLILNQDSFEDNILGKYGQFNIIEVRKTCYLAFLESIVGE